MKISPIEKSDYSDLALMVGELLNEIMLTINHKTFNYNQTDIIKRIEVTTPPLPEFDRIFEFYQRSGFENSGGRKLKIDIKA